MTLTPGHSQIYIIPERCKGCRFCIEFCQQHILYQSNEMNSKGYHTVEVTDNNKCNGCNTCSMMCPEFAISVITEEAEEETEPPY